MAKNYRKSSKKAQKCPTREIVCETNRIDPKRREKKHTHTHTQYKYPELVQIGTKHPKPAKTYTKSIKEQETTTKKIQMVQNWLKTVENALKLGPTMPERGQNWSKLVVDVYLLPEKAKNAKEK